MALARAGVALTPSELDEPADDWPETASIEHEDTASA